MRLPVRRWGNSLAIRLPRGIALDVSLTEGSEVEVTVENGRVILTPTRGPGSLASLLDQVTDANRHGEFDAGAPVGGELW